MCFQHSLLLQYLVFCGPDLRKLHCYPTNHIMDGPIATSLVPFVTGNPKLEMRSGVLRVYRSLVRAARERQGPDEGYDDNEDQPCLDHSGESPLPGTVKSRVVAIMCVPARYVPTDLICVLKPFHAYTRALRLLRHCDDPRQFIALVFLDSADHAESLIAALDGKPFNSFEHAPALLALVHDVAFDASRGASPRQLVRPSPRTTFELPGHHTHGGQREAAVSLAAASGLLSKHDAGAVRSTAHGLGSVPLPSDALPDALTIEAAALPLLAPLKPLSEERVDNAGDEERWARVFPCRRGVGVALSSPSVSPAPSPGGASGETSSTSDAVAQCVVCLEALGNSAVLTTACNHDFHVACLAQWQDAPCPVCRYHHNVAHITSTCQWREQDGFGGRVEDIDSGSGGEADECGASVGLLCCLICGFVGCGGGPGGGGHARRHYEESMHAYALEVETRQVWDFAGDGYVHRLVLSKGYDDDALLPSDQYYAPKLVETASPGSIVEASEYWSQMNDTPFSSTCGDALLNSPTSPGPGAGGGGGGGGTRENIPIALSPIAGSYGRPSVPPSRLFSSPGLSIGILASAAGRGSSRRTGRDELGDSSGLVEDEEDEAMHRKLEGLSYQYNELLCSQLEAQRAYFASELDSVRKQYRQRNWLARSEADLGRGGRNEGAVGVSGGDAESRAEAAADSPAALLALLERESGALVQRVDAARRRTARLRAEVGVVEACNAQIADNITSWAKAEETAVRELDEVANTRARLVAPLEARVEELMRRLDCAAGPVGELERSGSAAAEDDNADAEVGEGEGEGDDDWGLSAVPLGSGQVGKKKRGKRKGK